MIASPCPLSLQRLATARCRLAKLVLSIWNDECAFSFRECISNLDEDLTALALRMVARFAARGEDPELVAAGHEACRAYPRLWELSQAADTAKRQLHGNRMSHHRSSGSILLG